MENRCRSKRYFNGFSICADRYNPAVNTNKRSKRPNDGLNGERWVLTKLEFCLLQRFLLAHKPYASGSLAHRKQQQLLWMLSCDEAAVTTISCVRQYVSRRRQYKTACATIVELLNTDCVTRVSTGRLLWWTKRIVHRNTTQPNKTQNIYKCTGFYCLYTGNIWYYIIWLLYLVRFIHFAFRTERKFWI